MIKGIISISGKPGLFKLLSRGKNTLIVENIATGKRIPTYPHDKVISLADISIYTDGGDIPLPEVFEKLYEKTEGKTVDVKTLGTDTEIRDFFATVLPEFDRDRVYTTDMKKLFSWYNQLLAAGITKFTEEEQTDEEKNKD